MLLNMNHNIFHYEILNADIFKKKFRQHSIFYVANFEFWYRDKRKEAIKT